MPDFVVFVPTFALVGGALVILLADLLPYSGVKGWLAVGAVATSLIAVLSFSGHAWPIEATLFVWQPGSEDLASVPFAYYMDAITFALLVSSLFAALALTLYATYYVIAEPKRQLVFYCTVLLATAAFVNMVMAGNMPIAYVGLQTWVIASFAVVAFWHHGIGATPAIARSFILTSLAATGVLIAAFALARRSPNLSFSAISPQDVAPALLFLFLLAAAAVAYQYPFHSWTAISFRVPLPAAAMMGLVFAPWAGVYLLSRFHAIAGPQIGTLWHHSLMVVGALTMISGVVYTLKQTHLRGIAIFVASAQVGYAFLGLGLNTPASISAALLTLVSGTVASCGIMICASMIERSAGTGNVLKLGGLSSHMPRTTVLFALFSLSLVGVPFPTIGFFAKWTILGAAFDAGHAAFGILTLIVDGLLFVMLMRTIDWVFFRSHYRHALVGNEMNRLTLASTGMLVAPTLFFGLAPFLLVDWLIKPAVSSIMHIPASDLTISLAGGFASADFWTSATTFLLMLLPPVAGVAAYMVALGNGRRHQARRASASPAQSLNGSRPEMADGQSGSAWFPWVINTSGMHSAGWSVLEGIARALRKGLSPADTVYSPLALLLAALTVLLALLE